MPEGHPCWATTIKHLVALYQAWDKPKKAEEYRQLLKGAPATDSPER